jgi:hypothetical protein
MDCPALNDNKRKYYVSKMKADVKLHISSSAMTIPASFLLGKGHF